MAQAVRGFTGTQENDSIPLFQGFIWEMSARILLATGVVICSAAAIYGCAYYKFSPQAGMGPIIGLASVASPSPAPAAAAEPLTPATRALFDRCVRGGFPTEENAERRSADCSKAIQTRELSPDELALARLIRGSARMSLGDKVMETEDFVAALTRFDAMADSRNPDALNLFRRAIAEDALGNTEKALDLYNEAIRLDPTGAHPFFARGVLLATRKRAYERAIEDFDKALALEPDNVQVLIRRGDALSQLGDTARGLVDVDRAIALSPNYSQGYFYRGLIHGRRNDLRAALADYDAAVERGPPNSNTLTSRAAIYSIIGRFALAIQDLDAALAIDKNNSHALFNRGYARFALGEHQKAIADYTSAIDLDPTLGVAYNNRCLTLAVIGQDLVKALADCDEGLKLAPVNLDVRVTRGLIYLKLGDPALALNEYNAALERDPNRAIALYGRGLAKIRTGDIKGGEGDQAAARTLDPEVKQQFASYGLN